MNLNLNYTSNDRDDKINDVIGEYQKVVLKNALDNAYKSPYRLNEKDYKSLQRILDPLPVTIRGNAILHPHPVPAILQRIAYDKCTEYSKNFRSVMDIGGTPLRTNINHHICAKIDCPRTKARYINSVIFRLKNIKDDIFIDDIVNNSNNVCQDGVENCTYIAQYAYMINVYDIPIENIPLIMEKHGALILDVWMFLPNKLFLENLDTDEQFYSCNRQNNTIDFILNDNSTVYSHDIHEWRKYADTTYINCSNGSVFVEHIEKLHTFTRIRFTRTNFAMQTVNNISDYRRYFNLYNCDNKTIVPDIVSWFQSGEQLDMYYFNFVLENQFVDDAYKYFDRQGDANYNYPNFAAYISSKSSSVYYQNRGNLELVYEQVNLPTEKYLRMVISLYVIGMLKRRFRTQIIGNIINYSTSSGLFHEFKRLFTNVYNDLMQNVCSFLFDESKRDYYTRKLFGSLNRIANSRVIRLGNVICERRIDCKNKFTVKWTIDDCIDLNVENQNSIADIRVENNVDNTADSGKQSTDIEHQNDVVSLKHKDDGLKDLNIQHDQKEDRIFTVKSNESYHYTCRPNKTFDPPGDGGMCGLNALNYVFKTVCKIPTTIKSKNFFDADELGTIANRNNFNLIVHDQGTVTRYVINHSSKTGSVMLENAHWYVVECNCTSCQSFVGDYASLKIDNTHLYVNCANQQLSDGAGQAKAFRTMFPNYDINITKPIDNFLIVKTNDNINLALMVAHDCRNDKDNMRSIGTYQKIFKSLRDYLEKNNKMTVYMPLLGTSIYGNNLCCFKHTFWRLLDDYSDNIVMCFRSRHELNLYNNTLKCSHGGYKLLSEIPSPIIKRSKYDPNNYNQILPYVPRGKMGCKFEEIIEIMKSDRLLEVSCAPGSFYNLSRSTNRKDVFLHYNGEQCFKLRPGVKPDGVWHDVASLNKHLNLNRLDILLDFPIYDDNVVHKNLMEYTKINRVKYMFKIQPYEDQDKVHKTFETIFPPGFSYKFYKLDSCNHLSCEVYVLCEYDGNDTETALDIDNMVYEGDKHILGIQEKMDCKCKRSFKGNCLITYEQCQKQYDRFLDGVRNNDIIDEIKQHDIVKIESIECIAGVAGANKSRGILSQICPKCSIIIAPFRSITEQLNKACNGAAVTFVKAINLLKIRKFDCIIIDEVFSQNLYYVNLYKFYQPDAKIFALGDPYQICNIDLDMTAPKFDYKLNGYLLQSRRLLPSVAQFLSKNFINGITTTNDCEGKITFGKDSRYDTILCHTQKIKEELNKFYNHKLNKAGKNIITKVIKTVHEAMGSTFDYVDVYCDDIEDIYDKSPYIYVALSRAKVALHFITTKTAEDYLNKIKYNELNIVSKLPNDTYTYDKPITDDINLQDKNRQTDVVRGDLDNDKIVNFGNDVDEIRIQGTTIERAIDAMIIDPHGDNYHETVENKIKNKEKLRSVTSEKVDVQTVQEILDSVFIPKNDLVGINVVGYRNNIIREIKSGNKFKTNGIALCNKDVEITGGRMADKPYVVTHSSKNNKLLLDTAIHRYMNKKSVYRDDAVKMYIKGLKKFTNEKFYEKSVPNVSDVMKSVNHYLYNLQRKLGDVDKKRMATYRVVKSHMETMNFDIDVDLEAKIARGAITTNNHIKLATILTKIHRSLLDGNFDELDNRIRCEYNDLINQIANECMDETDKKSFNDLNSEWYEDKNKNIQFHLKNQPKEVRGKNFDLSDKVGQGVSAWGKLMNVILSGFEKDFEMNLNNNLKEKVHIATNMSDREISNKIFVPNGELYSKRQFKKINSDIKEFDSSQGASVTLLFAMILKWKGYSEKAVNCMLRIMKKYCCVAITSENNEMYRIIFDVNWVMTSGALFTLWRNTLTTMCIIGASFNIDNLKLAVFKGDDAHIVCTNYSKIKYGDNYMNEYLGHSLKLSDNKISEFIANIITPEGFFPDVVRRVSRVVSRIYTHPENWEEIKLSIADSLDVINSDKHLSNGCKIASIHYEFEGYKITPDQIRTMVVFLTRCLYDETLKPSINNKWVIRQLILD